MTKKSPLDLRGRVAVITGGGGLLGPRHGAAVAEAGGVAVLADIRPEAAKAAARKIGSGAWGLGCDITRRESVERALKAVLRKHGRVDILINNAANDPKVGAGAPAQWTRFENFPLDVWQKDIAVGLTGALICSQVFGTEMARQGRGVILNISSDLGLIAPDQRIYAHPGLAWDAQPVKPVTYSVIKTGLLGLTRYLASYWGHRGVRANALCPGGVEAGQPDDFKRRLNALIALGRMARQDEYKAAVLFMVSDASSYMTGSVVSVDGGRTCW